MQEEEKNPVKLGSHVDVLRRNEQDEERFYLYFALSTIMFRLMSIRLI